MKGMYNGLKKEDAVVLREAIQHAANQSGVRRQVLEMALTYFIDGITKSVCRGNVIMIPTLCGIYPYLRILKDKVYVSPKFMPATGFSKDVSMNCPPGATKNQRAVSRHSNSRLTHKPSGACGRAIIRRWIKAQAREEGFDDIENLPR